MALMPEVQFLLSDPDLGAHRFTIYRREGGRWQNGTFVLPECNTEPIGAIGIVAPTSPEDLQFFPEGERRNDMKTVYSKTMMYLTEGDAVSDEIEWHGDRYKIIRCDRYDDWGFCVAYAAKR